MQTNNVDVNYKRKRAERERRMGVLKELEKIHLLSETLASTEE